MYIIISYESTVYWMLHRRREKEELEEKRKKGVGEWTWINSLDCLLNSALSSSPQTTRDLNPAGN